MNKVENPPLKPSYGSAKLKLIEATLDCLMEGGVEGYSARKICARANVAPGLINYHFSTIKHLIAAAYRHLALTMLDDAMSKSDLFDENPRRQLSEFIQEIFSTKVMDRRSLRAWIVFWGLLETSEEVKKAHSETNSAFWMSLETIMKKLGESGTITPTPKLAAIGLTAMIDGLWLEWCLQPGNFTPEDAVKLCEKWVDAIWMPAAQAIQDQ